MKKNILLAIGVAGLAVAGASAKTYSVTFYEPAIVGNMTLKPGDYKVDVNDQKAVLRNGKVRCEAPVKVEDSGTKYSATSVRFSNGDGKMHLQEIHVGGSKTKLVFNE